ncbi:MAG: hypothetical protein HeimC2_08340 [Candidatus Heimdallarchaeota archaeon LC_2]|nr:MAG: hypothetical protein HeimC2_08340 [Candidatus Heimdallarchaeota archaeon LC_2]
MSEEFEELPFVEEKKPDESSDQPMISLYFENTIGPSHRKEKLTVNSEMPVADLKYTLSQIFNLPSDEFHLIHGGMTMDNEDLLSNFNLAEGDVLLIIPVTTAG